MTLPGETVGARPNWDGATCGTCFQEPCRCGLSATEDGLSLEFTRKHMEDLVYCAEWTRWYRWNGLRWDPDKTLRVYDLARVICRRAGESPEHRRVRTRLQSAQTVAAIERLARSHPVHARESSDFDKSTMLLNTPGGTVDLETGELRPHSRLDLITKATTVAPAGDCPTWQTCLRTWCAGDDELVAFLQRLAGYGLSGSTREQVFAFFYGTGANGKGSFLNTLTDILADYARIAPTDTFTASTGERHPTDLAMLRGARLVVAQETADGRRWDETRVKALTGGDPISARFMRGDYFTYVPQFKLVIAGNNKPGLRNVDEAMRRRLLLVPFTVTIPAGQRDPNLRDKLMAEASGILAWAIEGCLAWQRDGLRPPQSVQAATEAYFETCDALGRFVEERCTVSSDESSTKQAVFAAWKSWAEQNGEYVGTQRYVIGKLIDRFDLDETRVGERRDRVLIGLSVRGAQ